MALQFLPRSISLTLDSVHRHFASQMSSQLLDRIYILKYISSGMDIELARLLLISIISEF